MTRLGFDVDHVLFILFQLRKESEHDDDPEPEPEDNPAPNVSEVDGGDPECMSVEVGLIHSLVKANNSNIITCLFIFLGFARTYTRRVQ